MRDAFIAVGAATDLRAHATALRRQWDTSFSDGRPTGVRAVVAESWSRLLGAGIEPGGLRPSAALDGDGLAAAREASPLLHAMPSLRGCLGSLAEDAEHVMVVCDADGRLLWVEGHQRVLEQARGIDFEPGMYWTEESAGTNAIGTALAIDHAVQIFSAEHFLPEQHPWWCSAAPIHDPLTGELLGVVDLSGPQRTAHPHSLGLVMAAAAMAEEALRRRAEQLTARSGVASPAGRRREGVRSGGAAVADQRTARVRLLTAHRPLLEVPGQPAIELGLRQAEVLALLALHPEGMSAERLTLALYGEHGKVVSTRALMSRLREVAGPWLDTRPYRLSGGLVVDLTAVQRLVIEGSGTAALAAYPGPLLETSEVALIVDARWELDLAIRRAALDADADGVWRWLATPTGRTDMVAFERFLDVAGPADGRRALIDSRRRVLLDSWGD